MSKRAKHNWGMTFLIAAQFTMMTGALWLTVALLLIATTFALHLTYGGHA